MKTAIMTALTILLVACGGDDEKKRAWTHPAALDDNLSPDGQACLLPQAGLDGAGNAAVAWYQSDGTKSRVRLAERRGAAWSVPSSLHDAISPAGYDVGFPKLAMGADGSVLVTWIQRDETPNVGRPLKSEYRNGAWLHPVGLGDSFGPGCVNPQTPAVAVNRNGAMLIAWNENNGTGFKAYTSMLRHGTWTHPAGSDDHHSPQGGQPQNAPALALGDNGDALIAWMHQADGLNYQILKAHFRNGAWTDPVSTNEFISLAGQNASAVSASMDPAGNAIIAWAQSDGSTSRIYKAEYRNGKWTVPVATGDAINPGGTAAFSPCVVMGGDGSALIAWKQLSGTHAHLFISSMVGGSWLHPASLSDHVSPEGQAIDEFALAADKRGDAIIAWTQSDGTKRQLYLSERRGGAWKHPATLADHINLAGDNCNYPHVAMGDAGEALVVWTQSDGATSQVFKSEYR